MGWDGIKWVRAKYCKYGTVLPTLGCNTYIYMQVCAGWPAAATANAIITLIVFEAREVAQDG